MHNDEKNMDPYEGVLLDLHYLPSIPYLMAMNRGKFVVFDLDRHYEKQSYQNRAHIRGAQGVQQLIIPISHPRCGMPYRTMKIDYSTPWVLQHQRALSAAYRRTPYGEVLLEEIIFPILAAKKTLLYELSFSLLKQFLFFMKEAIPMRILEKRESIDRFLDLRSHFHPKKSLPSGDYASVYPQRFHSFIPNLSVVDWLASQGRKSLKK